MNQLQDRTALTTRVLLGAIAAVLDNESGKNLLKVTDRSDVVLS